jgi:hypothetical protein
VLNFSDGQIIVGPTATRMETIGEALICESDDIGLSDGNGERTMVRGTQFDVTGTENQGIRGESRRRDGKHVVRTALRHRIVEQAQSIILYTTTATLILPCMGGERGGLVRLVVALERVDGVVRTRGIILSSKIHALYIL